MWKENIFSSTSKFSNIFFKEKNKLINKIDFFLNNKEWYFEKGIPYTLGICLHGPPGTGKTSFIKALGNHTQREIILISLKLIKTKNQLDTVYFEDRYNLDNKKGSIDFSNKIIVFEDIDCIGDIVLDRNRTVIDTNFIDKSLTKEEEISKFLQINKIQENPLTLDDILNLWDGIRETPGRIMCITTNHYEKLDPALIRPGRIDLCMEMSYISYITMKEMYEHLFQEKIDVEKFYNIKENFYSPAEIISIYMSSERNSIKFIEILEKNQHLNNYTFIK
jgi:chaperone BCS1